MRRDARNLPVTTVGSWPTARGHERQLRRCERKGSGPVVGQLWIALMGRYVSHLDSRSAGLVAWNLSSNLMMAAQPKFARG